MYNRFVSSTLPENKNINSFPIQQEIALNTLKPGKEGMEPIARSDLSAFLCVNRSRI